jgi:hypothetical protein
MFNRKEKQKFSFSIKELQTEPETFSVLYHTEKDVYEIIEEAVKLFYYGKSGWMEAWPLTFTVYNSKGMFIAEAYVFVMSATPTFDVILVK